MKILISGRTKGGDDMTGYDRIMLTKFSKLDIYEKKKIYLCRFCPAAYLRPGQLIKHLIHSHEDQTNAYHDKALHV